MIRRANIFLTVSGLLILFTACGGRDDGAAKIAPSASPASANPPADIVRADASEVEVRAGGAGEATVQVIIADGYHVNANPATHSFLIPTKLDVTAENGITTGAPVYPAPLTKKFAFDEKPLAVYEGTATIRLPVAAGATVPKGAHTLRAKLRVQPCDDNACFPPRTVETSIPVKVN